MTLCHILPERRGVNMDKTNKQLTNHQNCKSVYIFRSFSFSTYIQFDSFHYFYHINMYVYMYVGCLVEFYSISTTIVGYLMTHTFFYIQTVLFQTVWLSMSTLYSSIQPIDKTISGATTPGQSRPGSDGNEGVFYIPQSSSIT